MYLKLLDDVVTELHCSACGGAFFGELSVTPRVMLSHAPNDVDENTSSELTMMSSWSKLQAPASLYNAFQLR